MVKQEKKRLIRPKRGGNCKEKYEEGKTSKKEKKEKEEDEGM